MKSIQSFCPLRKVLIFPIISQLTHRFQSEKLLLEQLEPEILKGNLRTLTAEVTQTFVEYYKTRGKIRNKASLNFCIDCFDRLARSHWKNHRQARYCYNWFPSSCHTLQTIQTFQCLHLLAQCWPSRLHNSAFGVVDFDWWPSSEFCKNWIEFSHVQWSIFFFQYFRLTFLTFCGDI